MIDFTKISSIIPSEGSLSLLLTKKNETITICYAPRFKGKENTEGFSPVTVSGTAEELSAIFSRDIPEIADLNETLFESAKTSKARATSVTSQKKASITKAISKGTSATKPADAKKDEKTDQKAQPPKKEAAPMLDLFSPAQPPKPAEPVAPTPAATTAPATEEPPMENPSCDCDESEETEYQDNDDDDSIGGDE